jgi:non-specific serine/threonine protein kinase/serine/threonine-protein kinase
MDSEDSTPEQPAPANDATVIEDGGDSAPAFIPKQIGPYAVKRAIGAGGMGTVVLAEQDNPKRDVAIKILNAGVVSRKALRRFEFEAQTLGKLQHPAIAQVYEAGM